MNNERGSGALRSGKLFIAACYLIIFNFSFLFSLDFSIRPKGFVSIPLGDGNTDPIGNEMYSFGGGGDIAFEFDLDMDKIVILN